MLHINGVNVERGLAATRGREDRYRRLLGTFYAEGMQKLAQIEAAFVDRDADLYTTYVHAIKSAAGFVGAESLAEAAGLLESAGLNKNWEYINKHNAGFLTELKEVLDAIDTALAIAMAEAAANERPAAVDMAALLQTLETLRRALDEFNSREINKMTTALKEYVGTAEIGGRIETIVNNKRLGEYEAAITAIDALLLDLRREGGEQNEEI